MTEPWEKYQEEAADFFRSLGVEVSVNAKVDGVRTSHDIDVLVRSHHIGFDITWLVECKRWKTRVSKLHVLALREIVSDIGADRGILLSETGFQSGVIEAANLTNVQATSLSELRVAAKNDILSMQLRELYDRVEVCKERYWDIPKGKRIEHGLRPGFGGDTYSGALIVKLCNDVLSQAFRWRYPFRIDTVSAMVIFGRDKVFHFAEDTVAELEPMVTDLEEKLDAYDCTLRDT